jgi:hypothetical protein
MRRAALALAALTALAACTVVERVVPGTSAPVPVSTATVTPANELMAYLARVRVLDERGLAAELSRQRDATRARASDVDRVKLAMALSLANGPYDTEVIADEDVKAMASFLHVQALERRRLRESAAAAGNRLREERRATEVQKQRSDALQQRVDALQERAAQLQKKLDALTELEKSLSDRQAQGK